ncbi:unnamed protein product [Acanthoscelides obtectus]|uniref:Uncharacterized protein n=1 Tax=Acanthoscelides obtectus TaxID=200917 RepID=A0A9P0MIF6_ACAOB|nr:unnamed protein product [Acanthoscelides obtectus]CAK1652132.1 hypothetical protein AOBTE_LOCUS17704 [Acanthoscelides obtectus]
MHHTISLHRRFLIGPRLNPALKKIVEESKIDSLLYGEDFPERLKNQQEIQRSSKQLKIAKPKVFYFLNESSRRIRMQDTSLSRPKEVT